MVDVGYIIHRVLKKLHEHQAQYEETQCVLLFVHCSLKMKLTSGVFEYQKCVTVFNRLKFKCCCTASALVCFKIFSQLMLQAMSFVDNCIYSVAGTHFRPKLKFLG